MSLDPSEYLGKLFSSRALFVKLYEEGMSVLPPLSPGEQEARWPIESTRSQADLARLLSVSASTVKIDLRRLTNYGWIQKKGRARLLGHRVGSHVALIADHAAETATGIKGLVSAQVLNISEPVRKAEAEAVEFERGPGRQWKPDGT